MQTDYVVEMKGICKKFGSVQALTDVDLELVQGEILAVVGDNGAGKSTLMKVLNGAILPDRGEIVIQSEKVEMRSPRDAAELGIGMIYQDLALFDNLSVAANICAGREYQRRVLGVPFLDRRKTHDEARRIIDRLKVDISSTRLPVERMSGGQRQMIACARAIGANCGILIMDEPTAALGVQEANNLLELIEGLKQLSISIILITHRLPDVFAIGDRVMVLKGGKRQAVLDVADCTLEDIVTLIVRGRNVEEAPLDVHRGE